MHILIIIVVALALIAVGYVGHKAIAAYLTKVEAKLQAENTALKQAAEKEVSKL